jgi:hypothetical protein
MAKTLLTIDTLAEERDTMIIDDVEYEVLAESDFGLDERVEMVRTSKRIVQLFDKEEKTGIARKMLTDFVKTIIPKLPDDVLNRLKDNHKLKIMNAFIAAVPLNGE